MEPKTRHLLFRFLSLALLAAAIASLYANTYNVPFYFDDMPNIVLNPYLRIETLSWDSLKLAATESPSNRRWLPNVTFALNHYLDGYDVWGYHLVNTVIHILTACIFFLLAQTTLSLPSFAGRYKQAGEIALISTLIWAAHPLQTNAVTYIVQRMTSMGALFYLLALYSYVQARLHKQGGARVIFYGAVLLLGFMALLSKENSGMLPVIIIAYELFFLQQRLHIRGFSRKKLLIFIAVALLIFILICLHFLGSNPFAAIVNSFGSREFTLGQRLLSETRIVIHYLSLLVLPLPSRLNLMYEYQLSYGLISPPQTLMAISGLAGMVFLISATYRKQRLISFALFWFLANLLVESSFIPLELVYEHRMYVPSMFLILAFTAWTYRLAADRINLARTGMMVLMAFLSIATWQRNAVWDNSISFWEDAARKSPMSMRALGNLGNAYSQAKKYKVAEEYLLKALALENNDQSGNFGPTALRHHAANIHENLALVYHELNQYQKAIYHANLSITMNPFRPEPLVTLGIVYSKTGQHAKAYEYFLLAWSKGIDSVELYNNWAVSSFSLGNVDEAINLLHKALKIDPDHAESHYNLGIAYSSKGMLEEAQREIMRAMQLRQKR